MFWLLQTQLVDSLSLLAKVHKPDSLNPVQSEIVSVAEKIANTPTNELFGELLSNVISFGLKVLIALLIYLVGGWLIKRIKKILTRVFTRRNTDAAIASFVQSIVSIALTIILIIVTVGALGVDTTSFAALLAGGGMAIGMALNGTVQNFAGGIMILVFRPFKAGDFKSNISHSAEFFWAFCCFLSCFVLLLLERFVPLFAVPPRWDGSFFVLI